MNTPVERSVGQSVKRREDARFLTGRGQYTDDIVLPRQTYAVFVRSPFAHARLGKAARRTLFAPDHARRAETVIELTAQRPVASWLLVQPDLQYVVHPGWNPTARSALVAGLRLSFALPDS